MGFGTFFNNLFRNRSAEASAGADADSPQPITQTTPPPARAQQAMDRAAANSILFREEILDAGNRLCGYRFSLRIAGESAQAAPEPLFMEALRSTETAGFARRRMAVIPLRPETVARGQHRFLAAPHSVLLLDMRQSSLPPAEWLGIIAAVRDSGCLAALTGVDLSPAERPLLEAADMVFLDLSEYSLPQFHKIARGLKVGLPKLKLAAEGVQSWAERRMCAAWGFEYCLGGFLATQDKDEKEGIIDQSRLAVIEMLNLIRGDAELSELGGVAKKDPAIAFQLLALTNSAAAGLASPVASLEQAILVLGRERLYRWLTVSMFRIGKPRDRDEALLEVAMTRARFLETVAMPSQPKQACDELFLVGLLSLFDILLAIPMPKILARMNLTTPVNDVLLCSSGIYAPYLMLALALEKGRTEKAEELSATLGIDPALLHTTSLAAFSWAQEALGEPAAA